MDEGRTEFLRENTATDLAKALNRFGAETFTQLEHFLINVPATIYGSSQGRSASPGTHVRHILDHLDCFLKGVESGIVDYDERDRDAATELDPAVARRRLRNFKARSTLPGSIPGETPLYVRVMLDPSRPDLSALLASSRGREFHFVVNHTVHHMAMIRQLALAQGFALPEDFGKAVSTLVREGTRA